MSLRVALFVFASLACCVADITENVLQDLPAKESPLDIFHTSEKPESQITTVTPDTFNPSKRATTKNEDELLTTLPHNEDLQIKTTGPAAISPNEEVKNSEEALLPALPTRVTNEEHPKRTVDYELMFSSEAGETEELNKQVEISYGCPVNNRLPCVAKCCDLQESHANRQQLKNGSVCVPNPNYQDFFVHFEDFADDRNSSEDVQARYEYFIGIPCSDKKYVLEPDKYPEDAYMIFANGSLFNRDQMFSMSDYCLDTVDGEFKVFFCFDSASAGVIEFFHVLYPVGQILSIIFLIATAATYLGCEELRDLQGKILVCHILCLTVAFAFLASVQLSGTRSNRYFCVVAAFIIQFSFIACFFWLNVLSYDTYWNLRDHFRSAMHSGAARQHQLGTSAMPRSERRQFIVYSLYAWNGPLILLVVSLVLDNVPGIPNTFLKPNFGVKSCWFGSETAALPYFFGPMGILLAINVIFFALSAYAVVQQKKAKHARSLAERREHDTDGKESRWRRRMQPYITAMKKCCALFVIMGLSWMTEIISWAAGGSKYIWVTTDVINTLQGLLIFYVFVLQPKNVRDAAKKRLVQCWDKVTHCNAPYRPVPRHQADNGTEMKAIDFS